jgi:hypothetical protein
MGPQLKLRSRENEKNPVRDVISIPEVSAVNQTLGNFVVNCIHDRFDIREGRPARHRPTGPQ